MKIRDYLSSIGQQPVTCLPTDSAQAAAQQMAEANIGAMPVLSSEGKLVGMISERDLANAFAKTGPKIADLAVADMLTKSVLFMGPDAHLDDAYQIMREHNFRHVPILESGHVMGMISIRDVLEEYAAR